MKEPAKRNHEDETMSSSSTSRHSTSSMPLIIASIDDLDHGIGRGLLFVPIVNSSMDFFLNLFIFRGTRAKQYIEIS